MVTGGQREAITDVIFSILTNTQTAAGAMLGAGADAYQKQQASGQTAGGIISQAKQKLLQNALVRYPRELVKETQKMSKSLLGRLGIQFSIASILKQSQIFTGVLGSVFQILGAMVDVFLAPLMPFFIRTLRGMVSLIPYVQEKGEQFAVFIEGIASEATSIMDFIVKLVDPVMRNLSKWILEAALIAGKSMFNQIKDNPMVQDATAGAIAGSRFGPKGMLVGAVASAYLSSKGLTRPLEHEYFDDSLRGGASAHANKEQEKRMRDLRFQSGADDYFGAYTADEQSFD